MIETKTCINVWSDMNTWIDFCIITESDIELAKEIIQQAYDDWWELEDVQFEPLGDYVSRCLYERRINMYRSAIVDELGYVMFWCDELQGEEQIECILESHPEWSRKCIEQ